MNIVKANAENINIAAEMIRKGKLVAFPTETVYGLGANGLDPIAAAKIFEVKERPSFNPLILHISSLDQFNQLSLLHSDKIQQIIKNFWPGPLTLVVPKSNLVPEIITAGHPTVALRMPNHPVALSLIEKSGTPIAAPSANKFSMLSPTTAQHVKKQLGNQVDCILDGGPCKVGVESTILRVLDDKYELLRPGGIDLEKLESIVGKIEINKYSDENPIAPGMLPYHYAPKKEIQFLSEESLKRNEGAKIGSLLFSDSFSKHNFSITKRLTQNGNLHEASANLFAFLHELENEDIDIILVEKIEEKGLGRAIMDRLNKAVKKFETND